MIINKHHIGMMYMTRSAVRRKEEINKLNINNDNFHLLCNSGNERQIKDVMIYLHLNPEINHSRCLISATEGGKVENVKVLIKDGRVNPISLTFTAIKHAIKQGHTEIYYLLKDSYTTMYCGINDITRDNDFYTVCLSEICKYERIDMLRISHEEVIKANFSSYPLSSILHTYNPTKKLFLDTVIDNCELNCTDIAVLASGVALQEGLMYVLSRCTELNKPLKQNVIINCLYRAIQECIPGNVKILFELLDRKIPYSPILSQIVIKNNSFDFHGRNLSEKLEDYIETVKLLLINNDKINIWNESFILPLINLFKHKKVSEDLSSYFFNQETFQYMIYSLSANHYDTLFNLSNVTLELLFFTLINIHNIDARDVRYLRRSTIKYIFIKEHKNSYDSTAEYIKHILHGDHYSNKTCFQNEDKYILECMNSRV